MSGGATGFGWINREYQYLASFNSGNDRSVPVQCEDIAVAQFACAYQSECQVTTAHGLLAQASLLCIPSTKPENVLFKLNRQLIPVVQVANHRVDANHCADPSMVTGLPGVASCGPGATLP